MTPLQQREAEQFVQDRIMATSGRERDLFRLLEEQQKALREKSAATHPTPAAALLANDRWIPFSEAWPPKSKALDDSSVETTDAVLVTNNINARDRMGRMSHVWFLSPIQSRETDEVVGFKENYCKVHGLTHWCMPSSLRTLAAPHPDALPDGSLSRSTAKRLALAAPEAWEVARESRQADVSYQAREDLWKFVDRMLGDAYSLGLNSLPMDMLARREKFHDAAKALSTLTRRAPTDGDAAVIASEMRSCSRYPLTYAYDWIKGTICDELISRSEASYHITRACERLGLVRDDVVREMADQYVTFWSESRAAEDRATRQRAAWKDKFAAAHPEDGGGEKK